MWVRDKYMTGDRPNQPTTATCATIFDRRRLLLPVSRSRESSFSMWKSSLIRTVRIRSPIEMWRCSFIYGRLEIKFFPWRVRRNTWQSNSEKKVSTGREEEISFGLSKVIRVRVLVLLFYARLCLFFPSKFLHKNRFSSIVSKAKSVEKN